MRVLFITPILLLTACNPTARQPAEDVAVNQNTIDKKVATSSTATSSATASTSVQYACDNGKSVKAVYDEEEQKNATGGTTAESQSSTVTLTIDGKSYTLDIAVSASGERYSGKTGPTKDRFFTWWTKDGALWLEGPLGKFGDLEAEEIVARCKEVAGK